MCVTSGQRSLRVKHISSQRDCLGADPLVEGNLLGVVQGVTYQRGTKDVLHGLLHLTLRAHQGQRSVHIISTHLET